jgi:hypothetical protein
MLTVVVPALLTILGLRVTTTREMASTVVGDITVFHVRDGKSSVLGSADFQFRDSRIGQATRMQILVIVPGELSLPVGDLVAKILSVLEPAVRTRIIVRYTGKRSEFSDGPTTVALVFDKSQEVDAVTTGSRTEIIPEVVVHAERGFIGRTGSEWRYAPVARTLDRKTTALGYIHTGDSLFDK